MLSVTAIADQYAYLYSDRPQDGAWGDIVPVDGAFAAIKRVDGIAYVMFRGSTTMLDWIEDFQHCAIMYDDPVLGQVHPGARENVLLVKDLLDDLVRDDPIVIVGHSPGAMHAAHYAGYRVDDGKRVDHIVMFGEPRPGGPQLSAILMDVPVDSFVNQNAEGHDEVTDVPFTIMPDLPYQHVRTLTPCRRDPQLVDPWGPLRFHHFRLYAESFGAAGPAVLALPYAGRF